MCCDRRGTIRRYMTDDVIKQAAATEDDDMYNESLQTNTRLMVSPYSASLNYLPHHHQYQHHHQHQQQMQHLGGTVQSTPAADKRWLDVTTIVGLSTDDDAGAGAGYTINSHCAGDRHVPASQDDITGCSAGRPTVCATHMYESPRFQ